MGDELKTLRIGVIGAGFIANFHLESLISVRNVEVRGVYSRTAEKRSLFCDKANTLGLGPCTGYSSLEEMLGSGEIDAVWILVPNHVRLETMKTIHDFAVANPGALKAVACEKPLARTMREAEEMVRLVDAAGLNHGYLENQLFASAVERGRNIIWQRAVPTAGRPYLARATEEHAGPHEPWFWQGDKQGGGVLLDMMCHSVEVGRFLLSKPGEPRSALKLKSATGSVANLKWQRSKYADKLLQDMGKDVDYRNNPSEDFARGTVVFEDPDGHDVIVECATSWAFIGAGLRIELEVLGAEYSMEYNSLQSGLKVFMSRDVHGEQGEDMIEKQNSEQGLMPVMEDEHASYGYTSENRHMVEAFRKGDKPLVTFHDGLEVTRILMGLYKSAELGKTIHFDEVDLTDYVPLVARDKKL
ncbi:Gfo/Idh/MocA family oxidoreductase [Hoeflea sp. G2-23]|uniref:Gfo/Idh/MocA family oxidoreductase n=1 Tax=Hoeflea algicola TaxID=2983763 RepID=A0ABT3Z9R2_9HYPH|nr:Gfo/Idh/MocA family oxidoreductase [Hoeflea algicola]MCY0148527.1 Gfo/Idh/MocA family oxidoreductase [Hoeflea algicola]